MEHNQSSKPKIFRKILKNIRRLAWYSKKYRGNKPLLMILIAIPAFLFLLSKQESIPSPTITITTPTEKSLITDQQVFVRGKVTPNSSKVTINNNAHIAKNGNGEFTAMIDIPIGKSILRVNSSFHGKESSLIFPIERKRTPEEQMAYQQKLARDKALEDQKVMGLKNQVVDKISRLQDVQKSIIVADQQVATIGAQRKIMGTIQNSGGSNAYAVKVIVTFFDINRSIVDLQEMKIVEGSTPMSPGQTVPFTTVPNTRAFTSYDVTVTASAQPAGVSDETAPSPTSTVTNYNYPNPANSGYR